MAQNDSELREQLIVELTKANPNQNRQDVEDELMPLITAYKDKAVEEAHHQGYIQGVSNFRDWFMDASIPASRHPIGMDIAEDLLKNYKYPYVLKQNPDINRLKGDN